MSSLRETIAKGVVEAFKLLSDEDIQRLIIAPYLELQDESQEQAELEAEALELYNICAEAQGQSTSDSLKTVRPIERKDAWLAVARKAREMAKEDTK